ncbi:uncharacterized protein [Chironomus tepperi]|uniref:uncharacterized protein isoform X2 n=1 Tax=Chironomus tepperi TaxID=113505 RepID=UPI00391F6CA9
MLKIFTLVSTIFMALTASGMPQQHQPQLQIQTTESIPSYVVLPQIPNNLTPPPPGHPSSFSIGEIRNRRAVSNVTAYSAPVSYSSSSSLSSSEERASKLNKKASSGIANATSTKQNDESRLADSGRAKIEAHSAPLAQIDLPGKMPPATHRILMNDSNVDETFAGNVTTKAAVPTTVMTDEAHSTTVGSGH